VGGGLVGIELAEFLSARDRDVTVLARREKLATEMALPRRWRALYEIRERGVSLVTGIRRIDAFTDEGVSYTSADGKRCIAPADSIIVASGVIENSRLAEELSGLVPKVLLIGDCGGVGYIEGAVEDGARVARVL
jgi:2,4-dienoyl-CoA reductase (NADPH2)